MGWLELEFEEVSDACLALVVHQVLTLGETAARVLGHLDGRALWHHNIPALQLNFHIQFGVCRNNRKTGEAAAAIPLVLTTIGLKGGAKYMHTLLSDSKKFNDKIINEQHNFHSDF